MRNNVEDIPLYTIKPVLADNATRYDYYRWNIEGLFWIYDRHLFHLVVLECKYVTFVKFSISTTHAKTKLQIKNVDRYKCKQ